MGKNLSREEQETVILFNESDDTARISTFNGKLKRKLAKAAEQRPDLFKRTGVDEYGGETWEVPRRKLSINPRVPPSDERRAALSFLAKSRGFGYSAEDPEPGNEGW